VSHTTSPITSDTDSVKRYDTVVIGAGPAGASAATYLARAGRKVALVDKATFPRDKCCGDGLTTQALRELELLGFDPGTTPTWNQIDTVSLRAPSGAHSTMHFPQHKGHYAAVVTRYELDAALVDLAESDGVDLFTGSAMTDMITDEYGIHATLANGTRIDANNAIAADGAYSPTRKLLGLPPGWHDADWHAFRQYTTPDNFPPHQSLVSFESDLIPTYFWAFPLAGGMVNNGFGIHRSQVESLGIMKSLWTDLINRPHLSHLFTGTPLPPPQGRLKSWPIPAHIHTAMLHYDNVLFAGDAAGASDSLTGEGIAQALLTGRLAASAITNTYSTQELTETYENTVAEHLFSQRLWSTVLTKILSNHHMVDLSVWAPKQSRFIGTILARCMYDEFHRIQIINPKITLRARPGAYTGFTPDHITDRSIILDEFDSAEPNTHH
jgi:geranylgeranyl reductase family protein